MTFSMKPDVVTSKPSATSNITDDQWEEWNQYYWSLFDSKEVQAQNSKGVVREGVVQKRKKYVAVCKGIVDLGLQPQQDASYEWKGESGKGDDLSEDEKAHIVKYPDNYFKDVDGKRMQFKPERPTQEFAIYFDVPKIEVDWSKHPIDALKSLGKKPLRVCYNGYIRIDSKNIEDFRKHLRFRPAYQTGKLSPNSPLMKMATALNVSEEYSKEYDIGVFANQAMNVTLVAEKAKDRYFEEIIVDFSEISDVEVGGNVFTREQQIPECNSEFMGVLLNGGQYSEDVLNWVSHRKELNCVLPRATAFQPNAKKNPDFWLGVNWEDSSLKKELDKLQGSNNTSQGQQDKPQEAKEDNSSKGSSQPEEASAGVTDFNEPMDFDDDQ